MNKQRSLGSLANLAKILEEASNPESSLREDRKDNKSKTTPTRKAGIAKRMRVIDAKRKFWYEKRLKEQGEQPAKTAITTNLNTGSSAHNLPSITKAVANKIGSNLLESLVKTTDTTTKTKDNKNRIEAWRRKPGDPIF